MADDIRTYISADNRQPIRTYVSADNTVWYSHIHKCE